MMSELTESRWAVVSERGREATALIYADALDLMRRLTREGVTGLSVVTATAADRFTPQTPASSRSTAPSTARRQS